MIKYYKTPDVIVYEPEDQCMHCYNGVVIIETDTLGKEGCETAMRMINRLGMVKCAKIETQDREVPTPYCVVKYHITKIVECPSEIYEPELGVFVVENIQKIDTNLEAQELQTVLYGE